MKARATLYPAFTTIQSMPRGFLYRPSMLYPSLTHRVLPTKVVLRARQTKSNPPNMQASYKSASGGNMGTQALANTAVAAVAAVNAAVSATEERAPDSARRSFVAREKLPDAPVDPDGLPLSYDRAAIERHWSRTRGALRARWAEFLAVFVPLLTKVVSMVVRGGSDEMSKNAAVLAKDLRIALEKLGPTFIKAGQMLSARPDVLPADALDELALLQDAVTPFDTMTAIAILENELGKPFNDVFTAFSDEPVAAASLAQVYRATLITGEEVAVKVQRPHVRAIVSKDLYVLRRAARVYQGVMDRFAPQQRTNYVALLDEWAVGFYTELDFGNEARNQQQLRQKLKDASVTDVYIPKVYDHLCSRRLLVSEWVDGVKLSDCNPEDVKELTEIGQEAFLVQLFQLGLFHADPHPGNLLKLNDQSKGRLAILDFGLVASLQRNDIDRIINAVIHLANKDYASLIDDFIALEILPSDCDRKVVLPLMDKALSPYVKGGGAKRYEAELRKSYGMDADSDVRSKMGGFSAMTRDAVTVFNDVPFSIPPYFALLGRAVVTLEGIALKGNPDYGLILSAYPFVARMLLREDRPELQKALQAVLYDRQRGSDQRLSTRRLVALFNNALGAVSHDAGTSFVNLDAVPEDSASASSLLRLYLSRDATSVRSILREELKYAFDILFRQALQKILREVPERLPRPPLIGSFLPDPREIPAPFILPNSRGQPKAVVSSLRKVSDTLVPPLTREDELYALALSDAAKELLDVDVMQESNIVGLPWMSIGFLKLLLYPTISEQPSRSQLPTPLATIFRNVIQVTPDFVKKQIDATTINIDDMMKNLNNEERRVLLNELNFMVDHIYKQCLERLTVITR